MPDQLPKTKGPAPGVHTFEEPPIDYSMSEETRKQITKNCHFISRFLTAPWEFDDQRGSVSSTTMTSIRTTSSNIPPRTFLQRETSTRRGSKPG